MAITQTSDLSTIQTMFEQLAYFDLRPQLFFDQIATVKPSDVGPRRGNKVTFTFWDDMAAKTTPLTENQDVAVTTLSDDTVDVTLDEYGDVAGVTRKLVGESFLSVLSDVANLVGYAGGLSLDTLAGTPLYAGDQVLYAGTATDTDELTDDMPITSGVIRRAVALLRNNSAIPWEGGLFAGFLHPSVQVNLMEETGGAVWHAPADYSDAQRRWNGEVGVYEGVRWMATPRASLGFQDGAGVGTDDVYSTIIVGRQALAKAVASLVSGEVPEFVTSPVTDKLRRFFHFGWYWLGGYGRFREECLVRIESGLAAEDSGS